MSTSVIAERHPIRFIVLLEVLVIAVYLVAGTVAHVRHLTNLRMYGLANLALTVILALLLTRKSWWDAVGFRAARSPRDLLYFLVPLVPMAINWVPGIAWGGARHFGGVLVLTLMVGFVEEVVFRGLMVTALRPRGEWRAVLIPALLFGLTHALNVLAGKSGPEAAAQVAYAIAIGLAFGALWLRTGILWPLVLVHFLIDFAHFTQKPGFEFTPAWTMAVVVGITVLFTAYGLWVMLARRVPDEARA
jgi:uncharacterized protein